MEVVQGHYLLIEASIISYQEIRATASRGMKKELIAGDSVIFLVRLQGLAMNFHKYGQAQTRPQRQEEVLQQISSREA